MHEQMQSKSVIGEKSCLPFLASPLIHSRREGQFLAETSHLCAVGLALLTGKINYCAFVTVFSWKQWVMVLEVVILQEVVIAVAEGHGLLLALVYVHHCKPAGNSKDRHRPNDHCVSCDTRAWVWGSCNNHFINCLLLPEGKTTPEFRVGGYRSLCFQPLVWEGRWHMPCLSASLSINKQFERV